jgi:hypothetical protein
MSPIGRKRYDRQDRLSARRGQQLPVTNDRYRVPYEDAGKHASNRLPLAVHRCYRISRSRCRSGSALGAFGCSCSQSCTGALVKCRHSSVRIWVHSVGCGTRNTRRALDTPACQPLGNPIGEARKDSWRRRRDGARAWWSRSAGPAGLGCDYRWKGCIPTLRQLS